MLLSLSKTQKETVQFSAVIVAGLLAFTLIAASGKAEARIQTIQTETPKPNIDIGCGKGKPLYTLLPSGNKVCKLPPAKKTTDQPNPLDDLPKFPEKLL